MRKIYSLIAAIGLVAGANAQITVDQFDVAPVGSGILQASDTVPAINGGSAGASQSWDFSSLTSDDTSGFLFTAPQWTPHAAEHPSSNLAADIDDGAFFFYLINDATGLQAAGQSGDFFGNGSTMHVQISPTEMIMKWPMVYQDTWMDSSATDFRFDGSAFGADSIRSKTVTTQDAEIDAYGTLTTPMGTFNVLRANIMRVEVDSTWAKAFGVWTLVDDGVDTMYRYTWWTDDANAGFPLVEFDYDPANDDAIGDINWLLSTPVQVGVEEEAANEMAIYPNPTNGVINLSGMDQSGIVSIIDMTGREVMQVGTSAGQQVLDIADLPNGSYIVRWRATDGTAEKTARVMKQ